MKKIAKKQKASALMNAIVFLSVLTIIGLAIASLTMGGFKYIVRTHKNAQALSIAEAGLDKAFNELNKSGGSSYTGTEASDVVLGNGTFSITVESPDPNTKIITSTGYLPNRSNYETKRVVRIIAQTQSSSSHIAFNYAVQIGDQGISMSSNSNINGNAYSNGNITGSSNSSITGDAYAVGTISNPRPTAHSKHPNSPPSVMPIVDNNTWKSAAEAGGTYEGNYSIGGNNQGEIGPKKIHGNFSMGSNSRLTLKGPLYVTGTFNMSSNSSIYLDQSFGSSGTVIIVDGKITLSSNTALHPTNSNPKGYILLVTLDSSDSAIDLSSNSTNGICYALNGGITISSNSHLVALVSRKLTLSSNASLDYDAGLANANFTSGPGGKWAIKAGTWQKL